MSDPLTGVGSDGARPTGPGTAIATGSPTDGIAPTTSSETSDAPPAVTNSGTSWDPEASGDMAAEGDLASAAREQAAQGASSDDGSDVDAAVEDDGADVAHMILKRHEEIDWRQLLSHMELYWEVLLIALLNFRFIYPTERDLIPRWVFDELIERLKAQEEMPPAGLKICRGRLLSPTDYVIDVSEWGFADVVGKGIDEKHERPKH